MRRWILRLLVAVQVVALVAGLPQTVHAEPTTTGLVIAMLIVSAITTGVSLGVGAIVNAFRKPKPGTSPNAVIQLTTAREGEGIPRIYGTFAVGAKVIDRGSPVTARSVQNGSGKRRGPPTTAYSASIAIMVCENIEDTILGVSRIWADNELMYSVDATALDGTNPAVDGTLNGPFRKDLLNSRRMQILLGQSTQTDRCDWFNNGDDNSVPAYRGVVTIWFDDMDLEPFYNRIPQIQVEVVQGTTTGVSAPYPALYECHLAGLDDTQINLAANPGFGLGVAIIGMQPFKNLLELNPDVCVAEVDGELKFISIPQASSITITAGEMGVIQTGREEVTEQPVKFAMSSEQSATIPSRIEVTYADPDNTYQDASVGYARQYGVALGVTHLQVPFSHTRASAQSYASKFIARGWTERDTLKVTLLPKFVKYHPGDVLTLTAPGGLLIDCRILAMDFKPGTHPVEITAVRQLRGQGTGNPDDFIPPVPDPSDTVERLYSVSVLANVPPMVDDHDTFDGIYWAAGPLNVSTTTPAAEWKGAFLFRNACGSDDTNKVYEAVAFTRTAAVIGKARTALANGSGTDTVNTVDIDFPYGDGTDTIVGIHDDAFTKTTTANLAILGQEVIQFRDISDVSATYSLPAGRVWRLQGKIKRGVRDTTLYTGTHAINDAFVLWNPDAVIRTPLNVNEQGGTWNFKSITNGQSETEVNPMTLTYDIDGGLTLLKESTP